MILMLKTNQMSLKCFYVIRSKHFHDSLNIVLILAPGRELVALSVFNFLEYLPK